MRVRALLNGTAIILVFIATYTTVALLFTALGARGLPPIFAVPGRFLFLSFRYAGFYLPVYLFLCAFLLVLPTLHRPLLLAGALGIIPFFTASLVFQLISGRMGPAGQQLVRTFGLRPAMMIFFFLTVGEIAAIYAVTMMRYYRESFLASLKRKLLPAPVPESADAEVPSKDSKPSDPNEPIELFGPFEKEDENEQWERFSADTGKISFPMMPELGDLRSASAPPGSGAEADGEAAAGGEPEAKQEPAAGAEVAAGGSGGSSGSGGAASAATVPWEYQVPEEELLHDYPDNHYWVIDDETRSSAEVLKTTLEEFKISAEVTGIQKGPVITMFEILPAPGVKLSKIVNLADNIALRLAASRVRIVAPIPGKHAVGIEVPNRKRSLVSFREMLQSEEFQETEMEIPIILGKDITGETQLVDLVQTPHLLIAGATGSGKSVCVNSIICSILYKRNPQEVKMMLIDPKIVELKLYNDIPHLLTPVITEPKRAFQALQYCLYEMERRYSMLDNMGVRDIQSYNRKVRRRRLANEPLPYIVVLVDEFADLMATSGKELEATLARLAAMSRAVGIHLVMATQRPSIDVITGLIKANIPSRIAFMVAGKFDSRIIIDSVGAEKLLGKGDLLFTSAWNPHPTRIQGSYLSEEEVERVTEYVRSLGEPDYIDEEIFFQADDEDGDLFGGELNDPLIDKAVGIVATAGKASASYLQRRLKIGYNRAARLVEEMEMRGIVGPQNGSKPRDILHIPDEYKDAIAYGEDD